MTNSYKWIRETAIAQYVLGSLLVIFGIADRATISNFNYYGAFHTNSCTPIWMGIWITITGKVGIFARSRRTDADNDRPSTTSIRTYLGFSVVSAVFAGVIIILYSFGLIFLSFPDGCSDGYLLNKRSKSWFKACSTTTALGVVVIFLAVFEFGFGIRACVCSCKSGICDASTQRQTPQMGQVIYVQTPEGPKAHIMTQGADGVPVAVPTTVNTVPQPQVIGSPPPYTASAEEGGAANTTAPLLSV